MQGINQSQRLACFDSLGLIPLDPQSKITLDTGTQSNYTSGAMCKWLVFPESQNKKFKLEFGDSDSGKKENWVTTRLMFVSHSCDCIRACPIVALNQHITVNTM